MKCLKMFFLTAVALSVCLLADAQVFVGGHIGLTPGRDGSGIGVNLAPEVGYVVNNSFTVGGFASYQSRYSSFGLTPYVRWNFVSFADRLRFFLSAMVPLRFSADYQSYGFNIRPGLSLLVAERVSLVAHIGTFGYSWVKSGSSVSSGWLARLDGDSISIGFCFSL